MARLDLVGTLTPVYNLAGTLTNTGNLSGTLSFTGIQYLDDLLDVDISIPTSGDVLMYDGSKWVNSAGGSGTDNYNDLNNKPSINSVVLQGDRTTQDLGISYNDLTDLPVIPAAQVNADWDAVSGVEEILNKPTLSTVATSGSYNDLIDQPTIPAAQVNSDWNAVSGVEEILNKPTIPSSLNDMSDVTITNPASSEALVYDGTKWVNDAIPSGVTTLAALSDVNITSPSLPEVLTYNGSYWVNQLVKYSMYDTTPRIIGRWNLAGNSKPVYQKTVYKSTAVSCAAGNTSAAGTWTSVDSGWNDSITVLDFEAFSYSGNDKTYLGHLSAQWNNTNKDIRVLNIRSVAVSIDAFRITYFYN